MEAHIFYQMTSFSTISLRISLIPFKLLSKRPTLIPNETPLTPQIQFKCKIINRIIVKMQKKDYTPTKTSKLAANLSYAPPSRQPTRFAGEITIARQHEALKLQSRQLQVQNRQLVSQVEKLKYQKNMNESKMVQKAAFEEEAVSQFQKEKSYQLQMLRVRNEEDLSRCRREFQAKLEDMQKEIKSRELLGKDLAEKYSYLEKLGQELRNTLEGLELELKRQRENSSVLTEQLTKQEFANKKLEMLADELEHQKNEMEAEIHLLLDIQAEKSRTVASYEGQIASSEHSISNLHEKLSMLTNNFTSLDEHISVMKERLMNAEMRGEEVDRHLQDVETQIAQREGLLAEQKEREYRLRDEIEAHREREGQRAAEIKGLAAENQRLYAEINTLRMKLYDISIEQRVDI